MTFKRITGVGGSFYGAFCGTWRMVAKDRIVHPRTFGYWPDVVAVDRMNRVELKQLQDKRLKELMRHAIDHVPFYRDWATENNISADQPPPLADWPIITKATIRADMDALQSDQYELGEMISARTSGSSGEPFQFRSHPLSADYSYGVLWRALRRNGIRPGDRRVYIWGRSYQFNSSAGSVLKARMRQGVRNWLNNTLPINAYDLTDENVDSAIDAIEKFRPVYLHGYVSALYSIARRMLDSKRSFNGFKLKVVITESEKLYDFQKETMLAVFGCCILEHYGSVEFGNIAQPDPAGRIRIAEDLFQLESLSTGELLVTNLLSFPYPLIRYRLGDMAEIAEPEPDEELPYAVLTKIIGRTVDLIPVKAGGYVHGVALAHVIDPHLRHVTKYQVHQLSLDHFIVKLVASDHELPQEVPMQIKQDLANLVGEDVVIDVDLVRDIQPASSGKYRWVHSDVSDIAQRMLALDDNTD